MPRAYRLLQDSDVLPGVKAGTTVYDCLLYDYGCVSEEAGRFGARRKSVTLDRQGGYPFFTVPEAALRPVSPP